MVSRAIPTEDDFAILRKSKRGAAIPASGETEWSDYGRAFGAGVGSLVSSAGGAAKYLGADTVGDALTEFGNETSEDYIKSMTPTARREFTAGFLPDEEGADLFDEKVSTSRALGLKTVGALPSLVATLIPGTMVARAALAVGATRGGAAFAGTITGGAADATLSAGEVVNNIEQEIFNTPTEQLAQENAGYRKLIEHGLSDKQARQALADDARWYYPLIVGAITAPLSYFGVEGLASKLVAGEAAKGALKNAAKGFVGEGVTEAVQEGSSSAASQVGIDESIDKPFSWEEVLNNALEGGTIGGILGAGAGAAFSSRGKDDAGPEKSDPPVVDGADAPVNPEPPPSEDPVVDPDVKVAIKAHAKKTDTAVAREPTVTPPTIEPDDQLEIDVGTLEDDGADLDEADSDGLGTQTVVSEPVVTESGNTVPAVPAPVEPAPVTAVPAVADAPIAPAVEAPPAVEQQEAAPAVEEPEALAAPVEAAPAEPDGIVTRNVVWPSESDPQPAVVLEKPAKPPAKSKQQMMAELRERKVKETSAKVDEVFKLVPPIDLERAGSTEILTYIKQLKQAAGQVGLSSKDIGQRVKVGTAVEGAADLKGPRAHLLNAFKFASLPKLNKSVVDNFKANDALIRAGERKAALEQRKVEGDKKTVSENQFVDSEGVSSAPVLADESANPEEALIAKEEDDSDTAINPNFEQDLAKSKEREKPVATNSFTVATDQTGKFQVAKKRKTFTKPGTEKSTLPLVLDEDTDLVRETDLAARIARAARQRFAPGVVPPTENSVSQKPVKAQATLTYAATVTELKKLAGDQWSALDKLTLRMILNRAASTKVHIVSDEDMDSLEPGAYGFFDVKTKDIVLSETALSSPKIMRHVVLHEGLHAAFANALRQKGNGDLRMIFAEIIDAARADPDIESNFQKETPDTYGLTDIDELISETFSNKALRDLLASKQAPKDIAKYVNGFTGQSRLTMTLWDGVLSIIRKALKLPPRSMTLLDAVLRTTKELDARSDDNAAIEWLATDVLPLKRFKGSDMTRKRVILKGATLDQIRQSTKKFKTKDFHKYVNELVHAVQMQGSAAQKWIDKSNEASQKLANHARANPTEHAKFEELAIDATMANVNLIDAKGVDEATLMSANTHFGKDKADFWQSKAQAMALQKRFEDLEPETRKLFLETADFYSKLQNEITDKLVDNVLDALAPNMNVADRQMAKNAVMTGKLTTAVRTTLNTATGTDKLFEHLQKARGLRKIDGVYFPLMRHGGYVVRTSERIKNLMGGTAVGKDGVEFRAQKMGDAKKAAKAFAQKSDLRVSRVTMVLYDRATGKRITADEAKATPDVDYAYIVRVQTEGSYFFDSQKTAKQFVDDNKGQFTQISDPLDGVHEFGTNQDLSATQFSGLLSAAQNSTMTDAQKDAFKMVIGQAAVRMMSGNRIQSRSLVRRNVKGASKDLLRNTLVYGEAAGRYFAKLSYAPAADKARMELQRIQKENIFDKEATARGQILNEIDKRVQAGVVNISQPPQWVQTFLSISFLDKLFSPGYSIVNAMQPWMVTLPYLTGDRATGKAQMGAAAYELGRAYRQVAGMGMVATGLGNTYKSLRDINKFAVLDINDIAKSIDKNIAKTSDAAELKVLMQTLSDYGLDGRDSGFELAQATVTGSGTVSKAVAGIDRAARQMPLVVEQINRATTAVASYRMAKRRGMSPEKALEYAVDAVSNTQGNYTATNAPPIFNSAIGRFTLQFKKYAQMMTYLLYRVTKEALSKSSTMAERKAAAKQIAAIFAVQIAMAGALSLPGIELLKGAAIVGALFGFGDGWGDWERYLREVLDQSIGTTWSELLRRGVLTRAIDVDVSQRLGLDSLWTFSEPQGSKLADKQAWVLQQLGAPLSLATDLVFKVPAAAGEGDWLKAAELLVPVKAPSDIIKAAREMSSGKADAWQAGLRVMGFRSGDAAEAEELESGKRVKRENVKEERNRLWKAYYEARTPERRKEVLTRIREYNKRTPGTINDISPKSIDRQRRKDEAKEK